MKIVVTGATGLVGARFSNLLKDKYEIIPLATSLGINITSPSAVETFILDNKPDVILHFAAKADVDGCEKDKHEDLSLLNEQNFDAKTFPVENIINEDWEGGVSAFAINVAGTKNLAEAAREINAKFIYISTDFVFSGDNREGFEENDEVSPINWYGATKYLGERIVMQTVSDYIIARISSPYGVKSEGKKDFIWKFVEFLSTKEEIFCVENQIITPTFIDDVVMGIDFLLDKNESGIWHIVGSSFISPFEIGQKVKAAFSLTARINGVKAEDFFKDRAPRPYHSRVKNVKISELGFVPKTFDEGLSLISK